MKAHLKEIFPLFRGDALYKWAYCSKRLSRFLLIQKVFDPVKVRRIYLAASLFPFVLYGEGCHWHR